MEIRRILPEATWQLRQSVMWPDKPLDFIKLPDDAAGEHYGLFIEDELVSVVSLFIDGADAQFRKFATSLKMQGQGYGTKLLTTVMNVAAANGVKRIWCYARQEKVGFYERLGFKRSGSLVIRNGKPYQRMEKRITKD